MVSRWCIAVSAFAVAGAAAWACNGTPTNGNNCGTGTPPTLAGGYTLQQYTFGTTTWSVPQVSGGLGLTASRYADTLTLPGTNGDTTTTDSGTYEVIGSECIRLVSLAGQRTVAGTFHLIAINADTTLKINGNDSLHVVNSVWSKN
jgi:hypothetical protein